MGIHSTQDLIRETDAWAEEAAAEIRAKRGNIIANKFKEEYVDKIRLGMLHSVGGAIGGMASGGALLGPLGIVGGAILGYYLIAKRYKTKVENLRYRYLYEE